MSFDPDDFNYGYGHWQGDAGIPLSIFLGNASFPNEEDADHQNLRQQELIQQEFVLKASKLFAHLDSESAILDALTRELLKIGLPYAVKRYGRLEELPVANQELSQNENCLRYLTIQLFSEQAITLDAETLKIVDKAVSEISSALPYVAYDKISRFQKFLHAEIVRHNGSRADLAIDRTRMREILSTARLHLSCEENKVSSLAKLRSLSSLYASRIAAEKQGNTKSWNGSDIKNWKLRHIKPMVWYYRESMRRRLRQLVSNKMVSEKQDVESLKDQCANTLAEAYQEAS